MRPFSTPPPPDPCRWQERAIGTRRTPADRDRAGVRYASSLDARMQPGFGMQAARPPGTMTKRFDSRPKDLAVATVATTTGTMHGDSPKHRTALIRPPSVPDPRPANTRNLVRCIKGGHGHPVRLHDNPAARSRLPETTRTPLPRGRENPVRTFLPEISPE